MRPRTNPFSCLGCTAHAHAACRICADIACASVARLVRVESSAQCSKVARCGSRKARALRCRRTVKTDTFTSLRMRGRRGGRKDPAPHNRQKNGKRQQPRFCCDAREKKKLKIDALRTDGTCNTALPTTRTITRTRLVAMACPCRVSFSSACPCSHCRALTQ